MGGEKAYEFNISAAAFRRIIHATRQLDGIGTSGGESRYFRDCLAVHPTMFLKGHR